MEDEEETAYRTAHWNYRGLASFPEELDESVRDAYLKSNRIEAFPADADAIRRLRGLRELHLCDNLIRALPRALLPLRRLRRLDLAGNRLVSLPESLAELDRLETLVLDDNLLLRLPECLRKMRRLETLSASDNRLLWLPQRVGASFYSTRFTFWRNENLHHVPFAVWLHALRGRRLPSDAGLRFADRALRYERDVAGAVEIEATGAALIVPPSLVRVDDPEGPGAPPPLLELCRRRLRPDDETPAARCDSPKCGSPLYAHALLVVSSGKAGANETRDVWITAYFCSKRCSREWADLYKMKKFEWTTAR